MTTTKLIYLTAVIVPGGLALLALALAIRLYTKSGRTAVAAGAH